ncbi:MAG: beta-agarase [Phycisphaerae bacterium]|nr:beta-agarase [Phycisphaerae bacterium]
MKSICFAVAMVSLLVVSSMAEPKVLFEFGNGFDVASVETSDATVKLANKALEIRTGHSDLWPGITLKAPQEKWDLTGLTQVTVTLRNPDDKAVTVYCRVDNPGSDGTRNCITGNITVEPGKTKMLTVKLNNTPWVLSAPLELVGMRGFPEHQGKLDPANITQLLLFINEPSEDYRFAVSKIVAEGTTKVLDAKSFLPFIDEYGQFIHADWPGKVHSETDLTAATQAEQKDLAAHPGPQSWNQYGGWTGGPQLKATGFFRVEKFQNKWWLVDPEGRLFWSHGSDCVNSNISTPLTTREKYFRALPAKDSAFGSFYGRANWAPQGYYKDHLPYETYDFGSANLLRKYGPQWQTVFADLAHQRLRSWGMNTIANWSDGSIYRMKNTPYTATISFSSRNIEGSEGYWGKFHDVFDPSFAANLDRAVTQHKGQAIGDPWCIGFFVHNELGWGDDTSLAVAALKSPADQPAKKQFVADLTARYKTIDKLNAAWGSNYSSWEDMLNSTKEPDKKKAREDLTAFYTKIAETYFKTIRNKLVDDAPGQLYLGCRFAWVNDLAVAAAVKYCEILAYNRYERSVENFRIPGGTDKPVIIGEFHFGALDRGMFHTGLVPTTNQNDRAAHYRNYVQGALRNPLIVGTHWFQFRDQATTGRGDGENYQIGLLDVCDSPYPETIAAVREVGYSLYEYRLKN